MKKDIWEILVKHGHLKFQSIVERHLGKSLPNFSKVERRVTYKKVRRYLDLLASEYKVEERESGYWISLPNEQSFEDSRVTHLPPENLSVPTSDNNLVNPVPETRNVKYITKDGIRPSTPQYRAGFLASTTSRAQISHTRLSPPQFLARFLDGTITAKQISRGLHWKENKYATALPTILLFYISKLRKPVSLSLLWN
jgi:hypothetical protein